MPCQTLGGTRNQSRNNKRFATRFPLNEEEYVGKSQALINVLKKEVFMKYQFVFRYLVRIVASMSMIKNTVAFISYRKNQNVLATVSWNR